MVCVERWGSKIGKLLITIKVSCILKKTGEVMRVTDEVVVAITVETA
jgi:hypothetical protein